MRRAAAVLVLAGCLESIGPEVGPPQAARCAEADTDPGSDVSFVRDIVPILTDKCYVCHKPGGFGFAVARLDLTSYAALRAGGATAGGDIVLPGTPCCSILWQKLSEGPPFGARMPLNGPPFLTDDQISLIHDWIAEGAGAE
jgi:hypothetical protein